MPHSYLTLSFPPFSRVRDSLASSLLFSSLASSTLVPCSHHPGLRPERARYNCRSHPTICNAPLTDFCVQMAGTPSDPDMSLSRSPSPVPGGGWASPGLNITGSGHNSPTRGFTSGNSGSSPVIWEGARLKNNTSNSGAASGGFRTNNGNQRGIMGHVRRLSSGLPLWNNGRATTPYAEKEKLGRGRWHADNLPLVSRVKRAYSRLSRRTRIILSILGLILLATWIFYHTRMFAACWSRTQITFQSAR